MKTPTIPDFTKKPRRTDVREAVVDVSDLLEDDDRVEWVRRVHRDGYVYVHSYGDPLDMNCYGFREDREHGDDTEAYIDAMKRRILFGAPETWCGRVAEPLAA